MLLRAARVGDGRQCANFFLDADDPRYAALKAPCQHWTRDIADYLRLNGLPTVEALHLQAPAYWLWVRQMRERIAQCKKDVGNPTPGASSTDLSENAQSRAACDPYDNARQNQGLTPETLGIRFPDV